MYWFGLNFQITVIIDIRFVGGIRGINFSQTGKNCLLPFVSWFLFHSMFLQKRNLPIAKTYIISGRGSMHRPTHNHQSVILTIINCFQSFIIHIRRTVYELHRIGQPIQFDKKKNHLPLHLLLYTLQMCRSGNHALV